MNNFLKRPYKPSGTGKSMFLTIAAFGLFIFLFLYLFKPFGLFQLKPLQQLFITFGFGVITFTVLIIYKFLIEPVVIGENWTTGRNILWDLLIASSIGAANYFYIQVIFRTEFMFKYLLYSVWTAILVGSIPVTISYIIEHNRMYRKALENAAIPEEKILWDKEIVLTAGNPRNDYRIDPRQIIYLCSNDNYVTIVTINDKVRNKTTIRGTLKDAETELKKHSRFIRCHKCYIVNLDFVDKVTGNNQNMKIHLLSVPETEIPVARSKADLVADKVRKTRA